MKDGEKTGNFKNYDPEGHLRLEGFFANGVLVGENLAYYADGTLKHRYQYKDGAKTGANIQYYPNTKIKIKEQVALNGIDVNEEGFDEEGKKQYEKNFRRQRPHGTWTYYFEDGKTVSVRETYVNGQLQGSRVTYYANGEKKAEETYMYNLITGTVKNYREDGSVESVVEFRASRPHGLFTAYYPNGKIKEQGEFVAGKKHKEWKEFDEHGNVTKTTMFRAGIPTGFLDAREVVRTDAHFGSAKVDFDETNRLVQAHYAAHAGTVQSVTGFIGSTDEHDRSG
jgi:antitoxin component YwqK of YwqJK toxin-antitoxin module